MSAWRTTSTLATSMPANRLSRMLRPTTTKKLVFFLWQKWRVEQRKRTAQADGDQPFEEGCNKTHVRMNPPAPLDHVPTTHSAITTTTPAFNFPTMSVWGTTPTLTTSMAVNRLSRILQPTTTEKLVCFTYHGRDLPTLAFRATTTTSITQVSCFNNKGRTSFRDQAFEDALICLISPDWGEDRNRNNTSKHCQQQQQGALGSFNRSSLMAGAPPKQNVDILLFRGAITTKTPSKYSQGLYTRR
jgi:hypothetical protein